MRCIRYIFATILLLILLVIAGVKILAVNTGFSTESLPENDRNTLLKNVNISMLADEPPKKAIKCFSVNEDGLTLKARRFAFIQMTAFLSMVTVLNAVAVSALNLIKAF